MTPSAADDRTALLQLLQEERAELVAPGFGHADAWAIGSRLVQLATTGSLPVTVGVVTGQQRLFHAAMPGTSADNDEWLARKVRTVQRFGQSSLAVTTRLAGKGVDQLQLAGFDPVACALSGGAVPVLVGEVVAAVVAVSGLTGEDDHDLVVSVLREWLRGDLVRSA